MVMELELMQVSVVKDLMYGQTPEAVWVTAGIQEVLPLHGITETYYTS